MTLNRAQREAGRLRAARKLHFIPEAFAITPSNGL